MDFFLSYADMKCSGRPNCHIDVMLLIKHSKPCPLELSSYLEASFTCINGKTIFNLKLCRSGMLRKGYVPNWGVWTIQTCHAVSSGIVFIFWSQFYCLPGSCPYTYLLYCEIAKLSGFVQTWSFLPPALRTKYVRERCHVRFKCTALLLSSELIHVLWNFRHLWKLHTTVSLVIVARQSPCSQ